MNYEIENFIGIFDNFFDEDYCQKAINFFHQMEKIGFVRSRIEAEKHLGTTRFEKDDKLIYSHLYTDTDEYDVSHSKEIHTTFNEIFWKTIYPIYADKFDILKSYPKHSIFSNKIQKTSIGQGYHLWHADNDSRAFCHRIIVYTVYLNTVDEGGETEFLYIPKRVKPKTGRVCLFPASYTHTHRGNPPISNEKYIMTGWIEL